MIFSGTALFILGIMGTVIYFIDRKTTGWSRTRLKFVLTCWALLIVGITLVVVGLIE